MADMRKQLTKLKVIELKEKLQELGKTPKGLKADLVNQLAEAYEEQSKGMAEQSAPMQAYQAPVPMRDPMLTAEAPDSQYYQQPVGQYQMPAQEVYDQTQNYLQTPYEQQYPYPTHPQVFSPPHEQQYNQSPAQYPMASQLSPRIATQMSPQLSTQIPNQLAPPIPPQITQQLSPQMAAQQYRPAEFQSPHRAFQSNEPEYHNEYGSQSAPDQIPHYGMPHMDIHSMPTTQAAIPSAHSSHPSPQLVHRPPVIENYASDLSQNQSLNQNIVPDLSAYKQENEAFIPTHPSMVPPQQMVPTEAPTDMIDFDDVSIGIDAANEVPFNPQLGAFETDQSQSEFDINDSNEQFQRDVNDGQAFSQTNQLPEMAGNDDTNDTEATNEDSTDVDSNESNQSFPNEEQVKQIELNSVQEIGNEQSYPISDSVNVTSGSNLNQTTILPKESLDEVKKIDENSAESVPTDSTTNDSQSDQSNDDTNEYQETQTKEVIQELKRSQVPEENEQNIAEVKQEEQQFVKTEETMQNKEVSKLETEDVQSERSVATPEDKQVITSSQEKPTETKTRLSTTIEVAEDEVKQEELDYKSSNETNFVNGGHDHIDQNGVVSNKKLNKNQKKKQRRKMRANRRQLEQQKQQVKQKSQPKQEDKDEEKMDIDDDEEEPEEVEIEYIPESVKKDPAYFQFIRVFEKFRTGESKPDEEEVYVDPHRKLMERKKPVELDLKDDEEKKDGEQKISKRKMKQMTRMSIADLKQRVNHPELVEMHDVTAKDPLLLLHLKATRNSVPVPRHWCYKRKYLQGKRGFEKPPFKLPEFIRRTGIMEMRQALQEKEESKSLKAQMREKIRPKMGKIDIDYQKLHDAFFKWQTKPKMTIHGDLYYEGKEFETRLKEKRPGDLSTELRTSLGMPTGPNAHKCPPPWLIAMQRYGPPPSYPNLKIPGLNAPIPDGCSFGYHAGGWGKPPVDEYGRPLYGDVFGTTSTTSLNVVEEEVDRAQWGEMEDESEEEESSEEEEEEPDASAAPGKAPPKEVDETGFVTPAEGLVTPSGLTSIPAGLETPDLIELRKRKQIEAEMESGDNQALYTVIPEKKGDKIGREMMGSVHTYDMSAATLRKGHGVDVALDPSDLEAGALDSASMAARYEQTMKEQSSHLSKGEDLSDMVAEHAARQKRKKQQDTNKSSKKYQFKF